MPRISAHWRRSRNSLSSSIQPCPISAPKSYGPPAQEWLEASKTLLARRTRALFLNARAAMQMAEPVAKLLARELGHNSTWVSTQLQDFSTLAKQYTV